MTIDTWEKPRSHGTRLTDKEREFVRQSFRAGTPACDVAKVLCCSTRTIHAHYAALRDGGECVRPLAHSGEQDARHLTLKPRPVPKWKPPKMAPGLTLERLMARRA